MRCPVARWPGCTCPGWTRPGWWCRASSRPTCGWGPGARPSSVRVPDPAPAVAGAAVRVEVARWAGFGWVMRYACREPDFVGAYFGGPTTELRGDAELPPGYPVEVMVVVTDENPPP